MNVGVAFLTGLSAGGLGCLAVQGGLLASCLDHQALSLQLPDDRGEDVAPADRPPCIARPILLFLLAKVAVYSVLGFLLGACGSLVQITPRARAALMVAIGLFMVGNGLRLLGAHPAFRRFVIEPPAAISRFIRRVSRNGAALATPVFLGGLTVFLPCGITQSMMAAALATGGPLQGAALLFAFTLGTVPLFFLVAYSAIRLGTGLERHFSRIVALILIALGAVSCSSGLNLAGIPVGLLRSPDPAGETSRIAGSGTAEGRPYRVEVSPRGYSPAVLHLPARRPATVIWVTRGVTCCARTVVVPGLASQTVLPVTGETPFPIPAQKDDAVLTYTCAAGRLVGRLVFDRR